MRVQLLQYGISPSNSLSFANVQMEITTFDSAHAFDAYDLTVIDLQERSIWRHKGSGTSKIDSIADFDSLGTMIAAAQECQVLVLYPKNTPFKYDWNPYNKTYTRSKPIKDVLVNLNNIMTRLGVCPQTMVFGQSITNYMGESYAADFSFDLSNGIEIDKESILTSEAKGVTFFRISSSLCLSTLQFSPSDQFCCFIENYYGGKDSNADYPQWLDEYPFANEEKLRFELTEINTEQDRLAAREDAINDSLMGNRSTKAILCTKDRALEDKVKEILSDILSVPDDFEDQKEEDFRYETDETWLLFEIKGSKKGLQRQHISKTNDHVQIFLDNLEENAIQKSVKGILIFASEIELPPQERSSFPERQLILAKRDEIAIMTSETLLKVYELKLQGDLTAEQFASVLSEKIGLVESDAFIFD